MIEEVINSIRKHAFANKAQVCMQHTSPRALMISIIHDGVGLPEVFDLNALSSEEHYGLLGISERVALLSGRMSLQRLPEGGHCSQINPPPRVGKPTL